MSPEWLCSRCWKMPLLSRICGVLMVGALSRVALQEGMENASPEQDLSELCRVLKVGALSRVALQEGRENASLEQDLPCFNGRGALQSGSAADV